ncbi:uncharacterized protein Dmoj_GI16244, isoform B [Drosophila mojavensis]|uniref:Uncharacterized protein, isoform B n=1 Tax=Drosophila mojavensis TaxID=7230 RepID=A0A0Q9XMX3_DROMO|nr:uncharacterized protein Dmoj_GI16244, isoform B [Drosophila mojavensis]
MYEPGQHRQFTCKIIQNHIKAFDAASRMENNGTATVSAAAAASSNGNNGSNGTAGGITNGASAHYNGGGSGSYSKNGTVSMHNYYVKNGHHCCT